MLLRPALDRFNTVFATTNVALAERNGITRLAAIPDANRYHPLAVLRSIVSAFRIVWKYRPEVVVTTGALPGLSCLIVGRLLGAKTIWIDSVANSEKISTSGWCARPLSKYWVTQWQHLATLHGAKFFGSLL